MATESLDEVLQSVVDLQQAMANQMRSLSEKMESLSTGPVGGQTSNVDVADDLRTVKATVEQIAEEQAKHCVTPTPPSIVQYPCTIHHPLTGHPMRSATNVNAFRKLEEGKSVFLPIARDSLILGERFMSDIIEGLQCPKRLG